MTMRYENDEREFDEREREDDRESRRNLSLTISHEDYVNSDYVKLAFSNLT